MPMVSDCENSCGNTNVNLRVLLVDDNPFNRDVGSALLSVWGIEPVVAHDGAEALKLVKECDFDIVLMDIVMPIMDGLVATVEIRRFERANRSKMIVPIVAYSSTKLSPAILRRVGLSAMLLKPSDAKSMGDCLRLLCEEKFSPTPDLGNA